MDHLNSEMKPSVKAPRIPPHPLFFKCSDCMFWNRSLAQDVVLMPDGNAMPVQAAMQMGVPTVGVPRVKVAVCQLFPKWESTLEDAYCWNFKNAQAVGTKASNSNG